MIAGVSMHIPGQEGAVPPERKKGRGLDKKKRKERKDNPNRKCKRCVQFEGPDPTICAGRGGAKHCKIFNAAGERLD